MKVRNTMESSFKRLMLLFMVLGLAACGLGEGTTGGNVIFSWIAPTERSDGTTLTMAEIAGYRIYYRKDEDRGAYPNQVVIDDAYVMEASVAFSPGTYFVVITTFDTDGLESVYSSPALRIQI